MSKQTGFCVVNIVLDKKHQILGVYAYYEDAVIVRNKNKESSIRIHAVMVLPKKRKKRDKNGQ